MKISDIDKNLAVESGLNLSDAVWFDSKEAPFSIHGIEGSISFGDEGFYYWKMKNPENTMPHTEVSMGGVNCQYANTNFHLYQIEDMANAVLENRDPMITGEEAKKSVEIILAIYESSRTGKEIYLD